MIEKLLRVYYTYFGTRVLRPKARFVCSGNDALLEVKSRLTSRRADENADGQTLVVIMFARRYTNNTRILKENLSRAVV